MEVWSSICLGNGWNIDFEECRGRMVDDNKKNML